jgi:hypothetical protein
VYTLSSLVTKQSGRFASIVVLDRQCFRLNAQYNKAEAESRFVKSGRLVQKSSLGHSIADALPPSLSLSLIHACNVRQGYKVLLLQYPVINRINTLIILLLEVHRRPRFQEFHY